MSNYIRNLIVNSLDLNSKNHQKNSDKLLNAITNLSLKIDHETKITHKGLKILGQAQPLAVRKMNELFNEYE